MKRLILVTLLITSAILGQTIDYDTQIQPIFDSKCIACHSGASPEAGMDLSTGVSYANIVNVVSAGYAPELRVASGDTTHSVLFGKIKNSGDYGNVMPPTSTGNTVSAAELTTFRTWISELTPLVTIAEAKTLPLETMVSIEGIVTSPNFQGSYTEHSVQDATGGLIVFGYFDAGLVVGDSVRLTGELDSYNGKFEIIISDPSDVTVLSSENTLPEFQDLSIAQILAAPEDYESELVRIDSVSITDGSWPTAGNNSNMDITDPSGAATVMRIDKETDVDGQDPMLGLFELQGIVGQYDNSDPYDSGYQIFPRFYTDFKPIGNPSPLITDVVHDPAGPTPSDAVTVTANIIDDGSVASASLNYTVDSGVEMVVAMTAGSGDNFSGTIPAQVGNALVEYSISATDNFGGVGTSSVFSYIVYGGTVTSVASIQGGEVAVDSIVTIQGVVTAEPYAFYPEDDLRYYFIQDADTALSGIKVYDPDRALAEGDEIRITGSVAEYFDMTEILDVTAFELLSTGQTIEPITITLDEDMERFEGCLVKVTGINVSNPDLGYGEWSISDGTDTLRVDDAADYYYTPIANEALASITGIMDYSFGDFKIQPRLARDISTADGLTRIQAIQQVNYSDLLPRLDGVDPIPSFSDTSYFDEAFTDTMIVTVKGIVTMPTGLSYAGNGIKFILQDVNGGPWSSILSYHPDSTAYPVLFEGDLVQMQGRISEFVTTEGSSRSNMTELWITSEIQLLDIGLPVPEEPVVATGDLRWPTTAEQWGNVVVKVEDAKIIKNNPTNFDILLIDDGSGGVLVDDDSDSLDAGAYIQPPAGTTYESVRGWVYHHYGTYADSSTYKLVPLYKSDFLLSTVSVDNVVTPEDFALSNYPNPFNPTTTIAFRIPETQKVQLVVYNQLGQHVITLVDKSLSAGSYDVSWNGLDASGQAVSSGLYFYRLVSGETQLVGKMTYLK
ncbi:MAG: T9SS type A sorting domain-containing protein [Candidatus Marinimicrobia bacterium]|nr:T9SS type A sorting domain-containing protein [Candidatus Neomarinimicrobiota bacterium]MCF7850340.1 T9SS type A sorting domain-containing protein [Candidatus Neomarinimicrobiota bacterium]MCF7904951.1 T9SS type A sorting domain-containing protein [Candidatus Neomarinimicrobiota bacterium]